jgi:hypothetical protein
MPNYISSDLSAAQIDDFMRNGFIRIEGAFSADVASLGRKRLWAALRSTHGLLPDNPAGWTQPVVRLGFMTDPPFVEAANTPLLHRAYDSLVGKGRWQRPSGLGTFPIRFPSANDPGDTGWHVDVSFGTDHPDFMQWRVNIKSKGRALLMLFLFSDVGPDDAPTRIRSGSHAAIARCLLPHGETGMTLAELAAANFADTHTCEEVLAIGTAGTVYLCHPFLVHSAQPHRGKAPRFIAQPPLLPCADFDPSLPPSPVQIMIRKACGME